MLNPPSGSQLKTYLFSYGHADACWSFEIQAESPEDAKLRVSRLAFAHYDGELIAEAPVSLGPIEKATVSLRNWLSPLFR
jgi:hypothetical protein